MIDIDKMFAEAASAAEDSGESELLAKSKKQNEVSEEVKVEAAPKESPTITPDEDTKESSNISNTVSEHRNSNEIILNSEIVNNILNMQKVLSKLTDSEKGFIMRYYKDEEPSEGSTIYNAFIAKESDLRALKQVLDSKKESPANRAFFLIALKNEEIRNIYIQIGRLNNNIDESQIPEITDNNKINACRSLESAISALDDNTINNISKLIEFTSHAQSL